MEEKDRNIASWWDPSSNLTLLQDCIGVNEKKLNISLSGGILESSSFVLL